MLESTDIVFSLSAPARAERGSEMPFYTDETVARQLYCATLSGTAGLPHLPQQECVRPAKVRERRK